METIQVVLGAQLLRSADRAAKRQKMNRSALIRHALEAHLRSLQVAEMEEQERRAYQQKPQKMEEYRPFEEIAAWPAE